MKNKEYHTLGTVPKSNRSKIVETKLISPNTPIYVPSLSRLGTCTSITGGVVKVCLWTQPPLLVKWCRHISETIVDMLRS